MKYLEVTQLRERVQKDAKDDVEANNCDEDEEGQMEQGLDAKVVEGPLAGEHVHFLKGKEKAKYGGERVRLAGR